MREAETLRICALLQEACLQRFQLCGHTGEEHGGWVLREDLLCVEQAPCECEGLIYMVSAGWVPELHSHTRLVLALCGSTGLGLQGGGSMQMRPSASPGLSLWAWTSTLPGEALQW